MIEQFIWTIDETQTDIINLDQNGSGSNGSEDEYYPS